MFIASKVILKYAVQGVPYVLAEFQVDTASNLPQSTSDTKISIGSRADVIDTGAVYKMGANDTWVLQEAGTAGYTKAEIDQLIQDTKDYADGEITGAIMDLDVPAVGGTTKYIYSVSQADGLLVAQAYTSDSSPTTGSTKLVQSGGVKTYVDTAETNAKADWFNLGTQITAATLHANDLNNYKTPGHYYIASNTTAGNVDNTPVNYAGKLIVELISNADNYIRQTYYANTDSTGLVSIRRYKGIDPDTQQEVWSDWITLPTPASTLSLIYGAGSGISAGTDLNDIKTIGRYYWGSTVAAALANSPISTYTLLATEPADWETAYNSKYFEKYTEPNTGKERYRFVQGDTAPTFVANTYYRCSGAGGTLTVEYIQGSTRVRQTFVENDTLAKSGRYFVRFFASSYSGTWSSWFMFEGTEVL